MGNLAWLITHLAGAASSHMLECVARLVGHGSESSLEGTQGAVQVGHLGLQCSERQAQCCCHLLQAPLDWRLVCMLLCQLPQCNRHTNCDHPEHCRQKAMVVTDHTSSEALLEARDREMLAGCCHATLGLAASCMGLWCLSLDLPHSILSSSSSAGSRLPMLPYLCAVVGAEHAHQPPPSASSAIR